MADISTELANIMSAIYGEEVRGSIHDAIQKMNTELDSAISGTLNGLGFRGNYNGSLDGLYTENDRGIWLLRPNGPFTDYPEGYSKSRGGILFVYSNNYSGNSYCRQELRYYSVNNDSESSKVWTRSYFTESTFSAFSEWVLDAPLSFKGNYRNGASINSLSSEDDRGIYKLLGSYTYSGLPDDYDQSIAGYLIVYAMGSNTIQELRYFSGSGGNENIIWRRNYSGSWNTWEKNIDSSLSKEGIAADAKAVGDKALLSKQVYLPVGDNANLNNFYMQGIYSVMAPQGTQNWPFENTSGLLIVVNANNDLGTFITYAVAQIAICEGKYAFRSSVVGQTGPKYSDWVIYSIDTTLSVEGAAADAKAVGDAISGAVENVVSSKGLAMSTDPQHPVKDLNDYKTPGIYYVGATRVTNWAFDDNYRGVLVVFNPMTSAAAMTDSIVQIAFSNGELAYRMFNGYGVGEVEVWSDWVKNDTGRLLDIIESIADINSVQNEIEADTNQNYYLEKTAGTTCRVKSSTGTELVLYSVAVTAKKNYRVTASNVASIDNAILAFATRALADNVSCSMLIDNTGGPAIDYSYSPTQDGYLFLSKGTNASMIYKIYEVSDKATLKTDKTLQVENMPADAKAVTDAFMSIGAFDILSFAEKKNETKAGITFAWDGDTCTVTGTATNSTFSNIYANFTQLPKYLESGKEYYVDYTGATEVHWQLFQMASDGSIVATLRSANKSDLIKIPADMTGMVIRLYVQNGKTVNETVRIRIYATDGGSGLLSAINSRSLLYKKDLPSGTDLFTVDNGIWLLGSGRNYINCPMSADAYGTLFVIKEGNVTHELIIDNAGNIFTNIWVDNNYRTWKEGLERFKNATPYNYGGPTTSSCDDVTNNSIYFISYNSGVSNISGFPYNYPGWLITYSNSTQSIQFALCWMRDVGVPNMKFRLRQNGNWTDWHDFYSAQDDKLRRIYMQNNPSGVLVNYIEAPTNGWPSYGTITYNADIGKYYIQADIPDSNQYVSNILVKDFELADFEAGKSYAVMLRKEKNSDEDNANACVEFYINKNTSSASWQFFVRLYANKIGTLRIPDDAIGILARIRIFNGKTDAYFSLECVRDDTRTLNMLLKDLANYPCIDKAAPTNGMSCSDLTENGVYFNRTGNSGSTFSDFPFDTPGWLWHYVFNENDIQFAVGWTNPYDIKYRYSHFGTWGSWYNLVDLNKKDAYLTSCDLNDLTEGNHFYLLIDSQEYSNLPLQSLKTGFLQIMQSSNWGLQIFYELKQSKVWKRAFSNGTIASEWIQIGGGNETIYNITQEINRDTISNTYNITTSPSITTDTNNYIQAVDTASTPESSATDMTGPIMSMLNSTGHCKLGPGVFYVSGNINMPDGSSIEGCGNKTIVRLLSSVNSGYILRIQQYNTVKDIHFSGGTSLPTNLYTDGTNMGSRHAIYMIGNADGQEATQRPTAQCIITNCWFDNFDGSAFYAHNTGGGIHNSVIFSDSHIEHCRVGLNIDYYNEYAKYSHLVIFQCYYACINNGGNNIFTGCTFHGVVGWLTDNSNNDKSNNQHGSCIGCTFNHIDNMNNPSVLGNGKAVHIINGVAGFIFTGCQLWYGNVYIENSQGVQFSDCLFGNNAIEIEVTGDYPAFFFNNIFWTQPTLNVTTSTKFKDNYLRSGEEVTQ